jgi:diaminopimelate decarboxylase
MPVLRGERGQLELGGKDLSALVREGAIGTPTYVYDLTAMALEVSLLDAAFEGEPHCIAYAIKANSAGPVVRALRAAGCGADVVSGAELALALACGVPPEAILFSGVAKLDREIDAALGAGPDGIGALQIESVEEIARVSARARAVGRRARISLRLNPEASLETLDTHAHIATGHDEAKFGVAKADFAAALALVTASPDLVLTGLSAHAGSQFISTRPYLESARALFEVATEVRTTHGAALRFVDTGGGFGIDYGAGCPVSPADFVRETLALKRSFALSDLALYVEPGRALVAAHGVLLATVIQEKVTPYGPQGSSPARRRWLMIDAGMNDLLRPALYQARHRIVALDAPSEPGAAAVPYRVVGPVCESSDDFGMHELPAEPPRAVAILDAGAYGYTMASRYNGRPLPAEVFVAGGRVIASRSRDVEATWLRDRYDLGLSGPALSDDARS